MAVDRVEGSLQMILVDVAGGHDLAVGQFQELVSVAWALHPPTDDPKGDPLGGRGSSGRENGRRGNGGGAGGGKKSPAIHAGARRRRSILWFHRRILT